MRIAKGWWKQHPVWGWGVVCSLTLALVVGAFVMYAEGATASLYPDGGATTGTTSASWTITGTQPVLNDANTATSYNTATRNVSAYASVQNASSILPANARITSIALTFTAHQAVGGDDTLDFGARISGVDDTAGDSGSIGAITPTASPGTTFTETFNAPAPGYWTNAQLDTLELIMTSARVGIAMSRVYVTEASVQVTYSVPVTVTVGDGATLDSPVSVAPGATSVVLDAFTLTGSTSASLSTVTVTKTGAAGVSALRICSDANGNGAIDPGDVTIASGTFGSPITIDQSVGTSPLSYLAVAEIDPSAADGSSVTGVVTVATGTGIDGFTYADSTSRTANVVVPPDTEAPTVPTGVSAIVGTTAPTVARISWIAATDNIGVTAYEVWRSTTAGGTFQPIGTTDGATTSFSDTSGSTGQQYFYKVRSQDAALNWSALSGATSGVTATWIVTDTTPPSVPTAVTAAAGAASPVIATLAWTGSTDDYGVTGYRVFRSVTAGWDAGTWASIGTTTAVSFVDTSGVPGQDYWYNVSAYDAAGNESAPSPATSPAATATWSLLPHDAFSKTTLLCKVCHVPHLAASGSKILRQVGAAPAEIGVCYVCHDGSGAAANTKTGASNSFLSGMKSGHQLPASDGTGDLTDSCASCHNPHAVWSAGDPLAKRSINGATVAGSDNTWCLACHNATSDWYGPGYPNSAAPTVDATGYPTLGTFPTTSTPVPGVVYVDPTLNAHASIPASATVSRESGDCLYCHASHRSDSAYDGLVAGFQPPTVTDSASPAYDDYAELCFKCHGSNAYGFTVAPRDIRQFANSAGPRSGHRIVTAGGTYAVGAPLPCYECHNPHGSARGNDRLLSDALGQSLSTGTPTAVRQFCFTCHSTADTVAGWDSATGAYAAVSGTVKVAGLSRNGTGGNRLRLPSVSGHNQADAQSCYACHGSDYNTGGVNVHNPSGGISAGGADCYGCHTVYQTYMEDGTGAKQGGADRTSAYHHVMGSATNDGDKAFAAGSYPNAGTGVYCLSCHVDHDKFNSSQASNLRPDVATANPTGASTDSDATTGQGVCTSCHATSLVKDTVDQKADGSTAVPKIAGGTAANQFGASAHDYYATSTYGAAASITTFNANCSKCHNDENSPAYKLFQTSSNKFGTHWSAERRLLSSLGATAADPLSESHCYGCHTGGTAGNDKYGVQLMTQAARSTQAQFALASTHPVTGSSATSAVECVNCHNPHVVTATSGKVTDPANTYNVIGYSTESEKAAFCLKCHAATASLPTYSVSGTSYVPATVTIAGADQSLMNKSTNGSRGHWSLNGAISAAEIVSCGQCHDNHGSTNLKLLGAYDPTTGSNTINSVVISANDNTVCGACHTASTLVAPATSYTRLASPNGYPDAGTWPGMATYTNGALGIHNVTSAVWPGTTYLGGDCKNCHDVHGTANTYDELRGTFTKSNFGNCFECHDASPSSKDIKQFYPSSNGGTQTQTASSNYGHKIQTAGGTIAVGDGMPCYDCHNPHGSAEADGLVVESMINGTKYLIGDVGTEIDMSTTAGVRLFCFTCHTGDTSSTNTAIQGTNSAGTAFTAVLATDLVEGIARTSYDSVAKTGLHLPAMDGHYTTLGTQASCYQCHGNAYASGGINVHNPGPGLSVGGQSCYGCHTTYKETMDAAGTSRANSYHHVLGTSSTTYTGDLAPFTGAYPTSATDVYCVSCHTDHNYFNANKGANLRQDIATAGSNASNSDYATTGTYGICVTCHTVARTKQGMGTDQAAVGASATPALAGADYGASAHQYSIQSLFGTSAFNANCSKCHSDEQQKDFASNPRFGTHWSASAGILQALGSFSSNPPAAAVCFKCHIGAAASATDLKTVAGKDAYNAAGANMSSAAEATYDEFQLTSKHDLTKVTCANCHNVHEASAASPVADPDNTYVAANVSTLAGVNTFCLKCHVGTSLTQTVSDTALRPYAVNPGASADVRQYSSDGHGKSFDGPVFAGRAFTGYAASLSGPGWVNGANSQGAPNAAVATSPSAKPFAGTQLFTFPTPSRLDSIDSASVTVRSQARGNWGALTGTTSGSTTVGAVGNGTSNNWTLTGTSKALAVNTNDGETAYISRATGNTNSAQGFTLTPPAIPANATNISVSVSFIGRGLGTGTNQVGMYLRVNGADRAIQGIQNLNTTTYNVNPYTYTWAQNPATNAAWTIADVNNGTTTTGLYNFGVMTGGTVSNGCRVTYCYLTISYQVPSYYSDTWGIQYTVNGTTWVDGVPASNTAEGALTDHTFAVTGLTSASYSNFAVRTVGTAGTSDSTGVVDWDATTLNLTYSGADPGTPWAACRDCHEQHGSSLVHLLSTSVDGQAVSAYTDTDDQLQCLACHRSGTTTGAANIAQYYPAAAHGTATQTATTRFGHKTKTAGTMAAGGALPCRSCHNPHGGKGSGYMLAVRTQVTAGVDTIVGDAAGDLAMSDAAQTPANANNVRKFCFTCHTTSDTGEGWNGSAMAAVGAGCQVVGISRTGGVLKLPVLANGVKGHAAGDTSYSCYVCHGDDYTSATSVNAHNPSSGESAGGIPCYTCHTVYRDKMEDGTGSAVGTSRTQTYHHVLGSATRDGDTTTYPTSADAKDDVYCLSCHVDHNLFSPFATATNRRSANLRTALGASAPASAAEATNVDFVDGSVGTAGGATLYATAFTNSTGTWTNTANSLGAANATVSTAPAGNNFDGRHTLGTWAAGITSIESASITVRSQATGFAAPTAQSANYYPTGDSTTANNWTQSTGTSRWSAVDDTSNTDYIYETQNQTNQAQRFTTTPAIPSNAVNISVSVYYTARSSAVANCNVTGVVLVDGTQYSGTVRQTTSTTWNTWTETWATNPSGGAWTVAQVNGTAPTGNLREFGVTSGAQVAAAQLQVGQCQLQVSYSVPVANTDTWAIEYTVDGTNWSPITAANSVNEAALTDHSLSLSGVLTAANYTDFRVRIKGTPVGTVDNAGTVAWDSSTLQVSYHTGGTAAGGICLNCHSVSRTKDTANQKALPGSTVTPAISGIGFGASAHDYTALSIFSDATTFNADCSKCHDSEIDGGGMEEGKSTSGFQTGNRFSTHYSAGRRILGALGVSNPAGEEDNCYACHSQQGDGLKVTADRDWYSRAAMSARSQGIYDLGGMAYGHHVGSYSGIHQSAIQDETQAYISDNKHVECTDCHDVHEAQAGSHAPGAVNGNEVSGTLAGVSGVAPTFAGGSWSTPTAYSQVAVSTYEYQICFKCHSAANTSMASWGGSGSRSWTDQSLEFSPSNASYHPVVAALPATRGATGSSQLFAQADLRTAGTTSGGQSYGGWTRGDTMYCSDCHAQSSAGSLGPHGSAVKWMLKGPNQAWPYTSAALNGTNGTANFRLAGSTANEDGNLDTADGLFCRNCHELGQTASEIHHRSGDHSVACVGCHIRVPHGGKVARLLNANGTAGTGGTLPARYFANGEGVRAGGDILTFITFQTDGAWGSGDCGQSGCSQHNLAAGESW